MSFMLDLLVVRRNRRTFNSSTVQAFVENKEISQLLQEKGVEALPAIYVDGELKQTGGYPATAEVAAWFGLQESDLQPAKRRRHLAAAVTEDVVNEELSYIRPT